MTLMVRSPLLLVLIFFAMIWNLTFGAESRSCYECTSGSNDGCDDPARLSKWATTCPPGTQGCLKMKAPGSPLTRSCGNPPDSPVPIKDGCVNKPGVGIICSCSSGSLCNSAPSTITALNSSPLTFVMATTSVWIFRRLFF